MCIFIRTSGYLRIFRETRDSRGAELCVCVKRQDQQLVGSAPSEKEGRVAKTVKRERERGEEPLSSEPRAMRGKEFRLYQSG